MSVAAPDVVHYEVQSPSLLAMANPMPKMADVSSQTWEQVRNSLEQTLYALRNWRLSWWQHWALLAQNILPRRYHWLITPNTYTRGLMINQDIVDGTATIAMRVCAAGMMGGLTSPSRPWFKYRPADTTFVMDAEAAAYVEGVEKVLYAVMAGSNFYDALPQMYEDLVTFGTAPVICYEDKEQVIRLYTPCAGEYFLGTGGDFRVNQFARLFVMTVIQAVQFFGIDNCSDNIKQLWNNKGAALQSEITIAHIIEPNYSLQSNTQPGGADADPTLGVIKGPFTWREYYWEWGKSSSKPLSVRGFRSQPFIAPRWATTSNDAYGRSAGMDALGDVLQLQQMTRRFAEAVEKMVRPPMLADVQLKNEPSSILPGHITYGDVAKGGMKPIFETDPKIEEMAKWIEVIQNRIQRWFFNDRFMAISQMEGVQPRNESEIAERRGEAMLVLGPVVEKIQGEGLSILIARVMAICDRRKMFPPLPRSLQGVNLEFKYLSMLEIAQRATQSAVLEQGLATLAKASTAFPAQPMTDLINPDKYGRAYLDAIVFPTSVVNSPEEVKANRDQRAQANAAAAKQAQADHAMNNTVPALARAGKDASQIDAGGGLNAMQMLLGQGGSTPVGAANVMQ